MLCTLFLYQYKQVSACNFVSSLQEGQLNDTASLHNLSVDLICVVQSYNAYRCI